MHNRRNTAVCLYSKRMNSLRARILLTFATLAMLLVVSTVWMTRESFQRGFLDYLNLQMRQRMETIALIVGNYHEQLGGFDRLRRDPGVWMGLLGERGRDFFLARNSTDRSGPPGSPLDAGDIELALTDIDGRWIAGRRFNPEQIEFGAVRVPVHSGDAIVGYIVAPRLPRFEAQIDQSFVAGQQRIFLWIALLALAVTLPLALFIASRILSPVKQLSRGVRTLSEGDYGVALHIERKDELGQLAEHFNQLSQTLHANRSAQQRWIADISHELRTPVAVLEAELEAIQDGIRTADAAQIDSLVGEVRRLGRLINDLYQLSRADSGDLSYRMETLDLRDLVEQVGDAFSHRIAQVELTLALNMPDRQVLVQGDESRLMQLLSNLLENSCRYTDAGGKVQIDLTIKDERVRLCVSDSEPGASSEQLPLLFDRLFRVEQSRNRETGGSGLGLAICKSIAQAHGGRLEAGHSDLGGLCMCLELPAGGELHK